MQLSLPLAPPMLRAYAALKGGPKLPNEMRGTGFNVGTRTNATDPGTMWRQTQGRSVGFSYCRITDYV
ncbi:hypothetical protein PtA15_16A415 [Puccinia triticina]|uniref:Uncharacterized protein n=1 Tax=Puccinia triticina TaxID=208348 RepID=A0ABY7D895_9BASI|nr:uncharacterized protein PtA15_16A415 [Puccinia triticina]WAQ92507.1 hypothetical protein PtA15_16A415 [Puccinia triticina]